MRDIGSWKQEMKVNVTIYDIPEDLLKEFAEKVIKPDHPSGISPAIRNLMRKAIEEKKLENVQTKPSRKT